MRKPHDVGQTARAGYQVGVRRTVPCSEEQLWALLLSPNGMRVWLGGETEIVAGRSFRLDNGTSGEIRIYTPGSHVRLTWQPRGWATPSTLQVRVIAAQRGTTVSFHQEQLEGTAARTAMKTRWERVIGQLAEMLQTSAYSGLPTG